MMVVFDPSDDFTAIADGFETVTLLRQGSAAGIGETVSHALRRAITSGEAAILKQGDVRKKVASDGKYAAADAVWHLPIAEVPEAPQLGDVVVDGSGERWTILEVKKATLGTRWRCGTRNVVVAFGLDDTISLLKAVDGLAGLEWQVWKTGIRARIQPLSTKMSPDADIPHTTYAYRIFVEQNVAVDHTVRVRGSDGTVYVVTSSTGADRLAEVQVLEAQVTRPEIA